MLLPKRPSPLFGFLMTGPPDIKREALEESGAVRLRKTTAYENEFSIRTKV
jgi:hypothetical protein